MRSANLTSIETSFAVHRSVVFLTQGKNASALGWLTFTVGHLDSVPALPQILGHLSEYDRLPGRPVAADMDKAHLMSIPLRPNQRVDRWALSGRLGYSSLGSSENFYRSEIKIPNHLE